MANFIKKHWDNQAKKYKTSHSASWGDNWAIDLEIQNISNYINEGDYVLDVGCANGYSTFRQLKKNPKHIIGIDYSGEMIEYAKQNLLKENIKNISFQVGDVLNLIFEDNTFDVVYCTRVIINLPNWKSQAQAIEECLRVTKTGGKFVLSEAFWEPLVLLNSLRTIINLKPLVEHDFNRYLKKSNLENYLSGKKLKFECIDFCSVYYLGSRFLRELVTNPDDYPGYSNPINEIFYNIEKEFSGGGFGIQQAYIIYK